MTPLATVLIPTHDHGPTLLHSVKSALSQTVQDLEVFIVGDGVLDITREIVADLVKSDERVHFFDYPKGPRYGEIHRHAALAQARGEIVCYLSDDDLWFPDHVERMLPVLESADFAHTIHLDILPRGSLGDVYISDLSLPDDRQLILDGFSRIGLSCTAHTLEMYRKLPHGWRTTPVGIGTDLYMWQQFLAHPECRAISIMKPTMLHFPSSLRLGLTIDERLMELRSWTQRLIDKRWHEGFVYEILDKCIQSGARIFVAYQHALKVYQNVEREYQNVVHEHQKAAHAYQNIEREYKNIMSAHQNVERVLQDKQSELRLVQCQLQNKQSDLKMAHGQLQNIYRTFTWRLLNRLLRFPLIGPLIKWTGKVLAC